jgi:hypothetical protein
MNHDENNSKVVKSDSYDKSILPKPTVTYKGQPLQYAEDGFVKKFCIKSKED